MSYEPSPCLEFELNGTRVWIREDNYDRSDGALMPEPDHDINTMGFGDSYAHLFENGDIMRYGTVIGTRDDLVRIS